MSEIKKINFNSNVGIDGDAEIKGDITAKSKITAEGDITAKSNISVKGEADIEGDIKAKDFVIEGSESDEDLREDLPIKVELGTGGSVGGYKTGDSISAGTSITAILKKLLQKAIPATYTKPTISLSAIGTTSAGSHEYGTTINAKMKATFTQNDAGALETISFLKNGNSLSADQNDKFKSISESFQLTETVKYTAKAKYKQGPLYKNNLGDDSPDGRISAGEITSSEVTFTPYRQGYFYGVLKTNSTTTLTSAIIREGTKKNSAYSSGNLPLIKASTVENRKRIFVACPADKTGVTKVIMPSAQNFDCTSDFKKQTSTVEVKGAEGAKGIAYNVWVYEPAKISDDQTFTVTLG
jgi:hypothetical protein